MASPYWAWSTGELLRDGGGVFPNLAKEQKARFVDAVAASMASDTPNDIVLFLEHHDRWIHIGTGKPHAADHAATIWYCYAMDVTEGQRHAKLLATARRQAEAAAEAKSRFLATMSHEVRPVP